MRILKMLNIMRRLYPDQGLSINTTVLGCSSIKPLSLWKTYICHSGKPFGPNDETNQKGQAHEIFRVQFKYGWIGLGQGRNHWSIFFSSYFSEAPPSNFILKWFNLMLLIQKTSLNDSVSWSWFLQIFLWHSGNSEGRWTNFPASY